MTNKPLLTAVVLGSGGHTAEMIKLLNATDSKLYDPKHFIIAETDAMSVEKANYFINTNNNNNSKIHLTKRSRNVGQSYFLSIFTTLIAILYSIPLIYKIKPQILLVNGPGTCLPMCVITYVLSILRLTPKCKIVFIESICRVKSLSLTGKLLYYLHIADKCIVQWPELKDKYKNTVYLGRLV